MDLKFLQCQGHEKYCRYGKDDDLTVLNSAEKFSPMRKKANLKKRSTIQVYCGAHSHSASLHAHVALSRYASVRINVPT